MQAKLLMFYEFFVNNEFLLVYLMPLYSFCSEKKTRKNNGIRLSTKLIGQCNCVLQIIIVVQFLNAFFVQLKYYEILPENKN